MNVLPRLTVNDVVNGVLSNAVLDGQPSMAVQSSCVKNANLLYDITRKFGTRRILSATDVLGMYVKGRAVLLRSILGVGGIRPEKEMVRPNTSADVAVVTDEHPIRDGAISHLPRYAVGFKGSAGTGTASHLPIAIDAFCRRPKPTTLVTFLNVRPELLSKGSDGLSHSVTPGGGVYMVPHHPKAA